MLNLDRLFMILCNINATIKIYIGISIGWVEQYSHFEMHWRWKNGMEALPSRCGHVRKKSIRRNLGHSKTLSFSLLSLLLLLKLWYCV
jgi:hypothetical protein